MLKMCVQKMLLWEALLEKVATTMTIKEKHVHHFFI
jgi:hypothetical protein